MLEKINKYYKFLYIINNTNIYLFLIQEIKCLNIKYN